MVDAGLYLLATKLDNGRLDRVAADLRQGNDLSADRRQTAVRTVFGALDDAGPPELLAPAYAAVAEALTVARPPRRLTRLDLSAAGLVVGWVVLTSALLGLPLLLPVSADVAHLGAQAWGMVLLFLAGTVWARHTTYRPVLVGLGLAAIGATMIVVTLVLGAV